MRSLRTTMLTCALLVLTIFAKSQETALSGGDLSILKGEKNIRVDFVYEKVAVGDYSKESEYIKNKTAEMNAKEAGTGDSWAVKWQEAKAERYHPKFNEMISKYANLSIDSTARYTLIFKVTFIEPGYQVGISKKAAQLEGTITLVESAKPTKKLATITVERGGGFFRGGAFDTATRVAEVYAVVGKKVGVLISKGAKD